MGEAYLDHCPGCLQRTLNVFQMEDRDERYCENCGHESIVRLAQRRSVQTDRSTSPRPRPKPARDKGRR